MSGIRTQREIARDLGVDGPFDAAALARQSAVSTRSRRRPNGMGGDPGEAELKRLRRENEILRQEREILAPPSCVAN